MFLALILRRRKRARPKTFGTAGFVIMLLLALQTALMFCEDQIKTKWIQVHWQYKQSDFVLVLSKREKRLDSQAEQKVSVANGPGQGIPDRGKISGPVRCEGKCCSNTFLSSVSPLARSPPALQSQENRWIFQCVSKPRWQEDKRTMLGSFTWNVLFQAASLYVQKHKVQDNLSSSLDPNLGRL